MYSTEFVRITFCGVHGGYLVVVRLRRVLSKALVLLDFEVRLLPNLAVIWVDVGSCSPEFAARFKITAMRVSSAVVSSKMDLRVPLILFDLFAYNWCLTSRYFNERL